MQRLQNIVVFFEKSKLAQVVLCMLIICILGANFYHKAGRKFLDVESHIPATILAKMYGYDLEGYGLSFVSAEGINDTYGAGAMRILQSQYAQDSMTTPPPPQSIAHKITTHQNKTHKIIARKLRI